MVHRFVQWIALLRAMWRSTPSFRRGTYCLVFCVLFFVAAGRLCETALPLKPVPRWLVWSALGLSWLGGAALLAGHALLVFWFLRSPGCADVQTCRRARRAALFTAVFYGSLAVLGIGWFLARVSLRRVLFEPIDSGLELVVRVHVTFLAAMLLGIGTAGTGNACGYLRLGRELRRLEKRCVACGYPLTGLPEPRCPECGARATQPE